MINLKGIEETLLKAAEGYKGTKNIKQQLTKEALANGLNKAQAKLIVRNVLMRLDKTESGKQSNAFGVAHNARDQTKHIIERISELKDF